MKPMRILFAIAIVLTTTAAHALQEYDHHDPAALNEMALQQLKVGAGRTALILLERAHVIFPGDAVIRGNLETLRAYLENPGSIRLSPSAERNDDPGLTTAPLAPTPTPLPLGPWPRQ